MPDGQAQFDGQNAVAGYTLIQRKDGTSMYLKGENLSSDDVAQRLGAAPPAPTMTPGSYQSRKGGPILNANDSTLHSGIQGVQNALGVTKPPTSLWDEFSQIGGSLKNFAGKSWDELQNATGEASGTPGLGTPFSRSLSSDCVELQPIVNMTSVPSSSVRELVQLSSISLPKSCHIPYIDKIIRDLLSRATHRKLPLQFHLHPAVLSQAWSFCQCVEDTIRAIRWI